MVFSFPFLTSAAVGAPRNDDPLDYQEMLSKRFVFPCPLFPIITVKPSGKEISSE